MKNGRYLKGNKGERGPSSVLFADSETVPVTEAEGRQRTWHMLNCWVLSGGRYRDRKCPRDRQVEGFAQETFWQAVAEHLKPREITWLFAHNWGFDCEALGWRHVLDSGEYRLEMTAEEMAEAGILRDRKDDFCGLWVDEGPPTICSVIHKSGGRLIILDSANWLPESLERIGESLSMSKVALPLPTDPIEKHLRRCRQDVKILERAMLAVLAWIQEHHMGNLRYTAASQALALFRHRLMPEKILLHDRPDVAGLERAGYYGGRIELYYRGKVDQTVCEQWTMPTGPVPAPVPPPSGPVYELDASGLYPSVMADGWFPVKLKDYWDAEVHGPRPYAALGGHCIADVLVESPVHPWPVRTEAGVCWCTGTFRTVLTGPELKAALQLGLVHKCWRYAKYELARHLRDFALECWSKRREAESAIHPRRLEAKLWKYIANSLHGKFAQRTPRWVSTGQHHPDLRWGRVDCSRGASTGVPGDGVIPVDARWCSENEEWRWWEKRRVLAGVIYRAEEQEDADHAFVSLAAYVAAAARERVREWMNLAGPGTVLAVHTDSLIVTQEGYEKLLAAGEIRDRELGYLRLIRQADSAHLWACGFYSIGEHRCTAGIARSARQLEDGSWLWEKFEPLSAAAYNEPGPGVLVSWMRRSLPQQYQKGIIGQTGWIDHFQRTETLSGSPVEVKSCER